ncbi:hypothetical protein JOF56_002259 [Kibdelosporangium banguiense]|uniref:DUF1707 domain-containing protein n=1 Tax=Kibdelosporangium banguiense TaxID=1365924 RepID=A0ABS4TC16_9PSEU|nr:DUF1707 domain-containing protein [Kibdelosporangium banguiense]MBP2321874.1 hypothetical protein [Kibdelosporangium banguiense]
MTEPPVDPRDFRVSDDERNHVVSLLQKAIGQGLITLDEFATRTDAALAAKTRSELNAVLVDLPGLVRTDAPATEPAGPQRLELRSNMTKLTRTGRWVVPPELVVHSTMSGCVLDFTVAKIDHDVVVIECEVHAAHVKLVLPPESTVDTDSLRVSAGKLSNKVRRGRQGRPHFVVRGTVLGGVVQVKRPWAIRIGPFVVQFPLKVLRDSD